MKFETRYFVNIRAAHEQQAVSTVVAGCHTCILSSVKSPALSNRFSLPPSYTLVLWYRYATHVSIVVDISLICSTSWSSDGAHIAASNATNVGDQSRLMFPMDTSFFGPHPRRYRRPIFVQLLHLGLSIWQTKSACPLIVRKMCLRGKLWISVGSSPLFYGVFK